MTTTIDRPRTTLDDDWWSELDVAVLDYLAAHGATRPQDIARAVGLSTDGVTSVLTMLAREGKVRIALVEPAGRRKAAAA